VTRAAADDTIVAIATAPGRGALAIVRLSGPDAFDIARVLVRPWPDAHRTATLSTIADASGERIDQAIVVTYRAPASFTGDDAVEITCHGGPIASASVMAALVAGGARPAEAGEFTRRAVLNGKLDLLQAEAVGDLVDAGTRSAHRVALSQLDGGLSRRIAELRDEILGLEALSAYDIDFPEEDDGPVPAARITARTREVIGKVEHLLATASLGEIVREGAVVVIAGAPNVGKSSLFNALVGRRRAIVTEIPGTTRDALEALIEADGWPVRLVDTAGLRDTSETVERLGIEVSREYLERADLVLVCGDSQESLSSARSAVTSVSHAPMVDVHTKSDLLPPPARTQHAMFVSAEFGDGLRELASAIASRLRDAKGALTTDAPLVTRERHRVALEHACNELRAFLEAWERRSLPAVVAAVHLRDATRHLEELIGTVDVDDVLDRVFSSFCVGK
jgi:tRNA modification GTPase